RNWPFGQRFTGEARGVVSYRTAVLCGKLTLYWAKNADSEGYHKRKPTKGELFHERFEKLLGILR
ncbi:MAG: hypothetical protein LUC47_08055, partial [Clostridiales bacterium]|nr:hypothetical protein [Clostridiales bacterium]